MSALPTPHLVNMFAEAERLRAALRHQDPSRHVKDQVSVAALLLGILIADMTYPDTPEIIFRAAGVIIGGGAREQARLRSLGVHEPASA